MASVANESLSSRLLDQASSNEKKFTLFQLTLITSFQLGLNAIWNSTLLISVPYDIKGSYNNYRITVVELFPDKPALVLGLIVATSSACTLLNPVIGFHSDRCTSAMGRRRPYVALGVLLMIIGGVISWMASYRSLSVDWLYIIGFMILQAGIIVANTAFNALLPDIIAESQRGTASAMFGLLGLIGSAMGYVITGIGLPLEDTSYSYLALTGLVVITSAISICSAIETPLSSWQKQTLMEETPNFKSSVSQMFEGIRHPDFALALIARICYYTSLAPQAYLLYMIDDLTHTSNPSLSLSILAIIVQLAGLFTAFPSGHFSERFGRKIFVYIPTVLVVGCYQILAWSDSIEVYYAVGVLYGAANGMYVATEMALGMDCLPPESSIVVIQSSTGNAQAQSTAAGRNMGLWGIAQSIGILLGMYMIGPLLEFVGGTDRKEHYTQTGYLVILSVGCGFALMTSVMVFFIKSGPKRRSTGE